MKKSLPIGLSQCVESAQLRRYAHPRALHRCFHASSSQSTYQVPSGRRLRTALFFPGHGVQRVGMTAPWLAAFPQITKPFLEELDHHMQSPLSDVIATGPNSRLTATENSQPAIMATSILILTILEQAFDFHTAERVDVTLGHSLGEFASLVAGGYLAYEDALRIISRRAQAMARCTRNASHDGAEYGMMALVCEPDRLSSLLDTIREFLAPTPATTEEEVVASAWAAGEDSNANTSRDTGGPAIDRVVIANINSKNQVVLSGDIERIKTLLVQLRQFGGHDPRAVRLSTDAPFHSPLMQPARDVMSALLATTPVTFPGRFPCVSNVSARPFANEAELKNLLARQATETVLWWESIRFLDRDMGVRRWIGIGPGKVGRNLVGKEVGMRGRDLVRGGGVWGISRPEEIEEFLRALEETERVDEDPEESAIWD